MLNAIQIAILVIQDHHPHVMDVNQVCFYKDQNVLNNAQVKDMEIKTPTNVKIAQKIVMIVLDHQTPNVNHAN